MRRIFIAASFHAVILLRQIFLRQIFCGKFSLGVFPFMVEKVSYSILEILCNKEIVLLLSYMEKVNFFITIYID